MEHHCHEPCEPKENELEEQAVTLFCNLTKAKCASDLRAILETVPLQAANEPRTKISEAIFKFHDLIHDNDSAFDHLSHNFHDSLRDLSIYKIWCQFLVRAGVDEIHVELFVILSLAVGTSVPEIYARSGYAGIIDKCKVIETDLRFKSMTLAYKLDMSIAFCCLYDLKWYIHLPSCITRNTNFLYLDQLISLKNIYCNVGLKYVMDDVYRAGKLDSYIHKGIRLLHKAAFHENPLPIIQMLVFCGADIYHKKQDLQNFESIATRIKSGKSLGEIFSVERRYRREIEEASLLTAKYWLNVNPAQLTARPFCFDSETEKYVPHLFGYPEEGILMRIDGSSDIIQQFSNILNENCLGTSTTKTQKPIFCIYMVRDLTANMALEYHKLEKEEVQRRAQKKSASRARRIVRNVGHSKAVEMPVVEHADIQAIGGGSTKTKVEEEKVTEHYETKFTDIDQQAAYVHIHNDRCDRLYRRWTAAGVSSSYEVGPWSIGLHGLQRLADQAKSVPGLADADEIAIVVFALERFDLKTATAEEKSKCFNVYLDFRQEQTECAVVEPLREQCLVEVVNPFKALKQKQSRGKPIRRKLSVHLRSAKHEYLFLRGLQQWHRELHKPDEIHTGILEDCLRLGLSRFYNALWCYGKEVVSEELDVAEKVSVDDVLAGHIRHVLVHNFLPLEIMMTELEKTVSVLGERIVQLCDRNTSRHAMFSLRQSQLFAIVVCRVSAGSTSRDMVTRCLNRMSSYVRMIEDKQSLRRESQILQLMNTDWQAIAPALRIWVHPARAIESCILQIGELAVGSGRFLNRQLNDYVRLCLSVRGTGLHVNMEADDEWHFDPLKPDFLASMIAGLNDLTWPGKC